MLLYPSTCVVVELELEGGESETSARSGDATDFRANITTATFLFEASCTTSLPALPLTTLTHAHQCIILRSTRTIMQLTRLTSHQQRWQNAHDSSD